MSEADNTTKYYKKKRHVKLEAASTKEVEQERGRKKKDEKK